MRAVASPAEDPALTEKQVRSLLDGPEPLVLAGSDTGALFAAALLASGRLPEAAALVLAGLPTEPTTGPVNGHPAGKPAPQTAAWLAELAARTACPTRGCVLVKSRIQLSRVPLPAVPGRSVRCLR